MLRLAVVTSVLAFAGCDGVFGVDASPVDAAVDAGPDAPVDAVPLPLPPETRTHAFSPTASTCSRPRRPRASS